MNHGLSRSLSTGLCIAALVMAAFPAASVWAGQAETMPWIKMGNTGVLENLNAVTAASKKSVWFAGDNGTILKWDGEKFTAYKVELPDGVRLRDIYMFSNTDGWAVGYNTANYYGRIYHWDGRAWKLATAEGIKGFKCCAIAFLNKQDGLIAGEEGHLFRWDGRTWTDTTTAIWSTSQVTAGRLSLVTDLTADLEKRIYVMSCRYQTHQNPPRTDSVYVRLDLKTGQASAFYNTAALDAIINGPGSRVFGVPEGKFHYLAGKTVYAFSPGVSTYQKAGLRQFTFNINQGLLRGLWMFGKDDGWVVGDNGVVAQLQPGPTAKSYWPVAEKLNDIWMLDKDYGFIAGDKGIVLMRNTTAGALIDTTLDKLEYDSGEQVLAGVVRVSQASPVAMPLTGALWEIKKETTVDERTTVSTVYSYSLTPRSRDDNQSLDPGEWLTLKWNQKNSQGRQVEPGAYRVVFRIGDQAPGCRFTIRAPSGPVTATDLPDMQGSFALDLPPSYIYGVNTPFKLVNHNTRSVAISGQSYTVSVMREDGWHIFYDSGTRSAFNPGTMAAGATYEWVWMRYDTSGRTLAEVGRYKLTVKLPGQTPSELSREFEIRTRR
ncbi:MAG: hypothetical protein PHI34_07550 [Acidobacteriota bacterium]|nr:hypothetical protein [Acidobacteriota bacterium]